MRAARSSTSAGKRMGNRKASGTNFVADCVFRICWWVESSRPTGSALTEFPTSGSDGPRRLGPPDNYYSSILWDRGPFEFEIQNVCAGLDFTEQIALGVVFLGNHRYFIIDEFRRDGGVSYL